MRYLSRSIQAVFTIYAFIPFTLFLLLIFPIVVVASFFGKIKGGNFIYRLCHAWTDFVLLMLGIFHRNIFEAQHDKTRQYVFVFNHISFLDIPIIFKTIRGQYFRILGKAEMAKIPLFGFIYRNAVVMVERDNPQKRATSVKQLKSVLKKGISVLVAPEGTFNMTGKPLKEFYDGAFKVAIETQTPVKPVLILDAYDRMHYQSIFTLNPGRSRSVYLDEIPVEGLTMNDVAFLKEKTYRIMEEALIKYKASWINNNTGNST